MQPLTAPLIRFFRLPALPVEARRTFRFHMAYAILDAAAGGILLNAPVVAIRAMHAPSWQLPLRELYSGIGMLATLYLGSWMARRRKMPFVFLPGMLCGLSTAGMAMVTGDALWFLTLLGISAMFEIMTRPATTAILRINYPAVCRGHATGEVRKWSSLAFVAANLLTAYLLQELDERAIEFVPNLIGSAAALSLASFFSFRMIRVDEAPSENSPGFRLEIAKHLRDAIAVFRDDRYRRYLLGCFIDGFCGMLYLPLIWVFLEKTLGFGYLRCAEMMHAIPALTAFVVTGWLGQWFDRSNPWVTGLDPFRMGPGCPVAGGNTPGCRLLPTSDHCLAPCGPPVAGQRAGGVVGLVVAGWRHAFRAARPGHHALRRGDGLPQRRNSPGSLGHRHSVGGHFRAAQHAAGGGWHRSDSLRRLLALASREGKAGASPRDHRRF